MGATEELFHVFRITAGGVFFVCVVVDFDGANWAYSTFITKDEISGFVFDEAVRFGTALAADFMAKEGTEGDVGDDVKTFTKDIVKNLEAMFLGASHELLFGSIMEALDSFAVTTFGTDADDN